MVEVRSEAIRKHSVLKADHSVGAWLSLVLFSGIVFLLVVAASIVFIVSSNNMGLILLGFPPQ